MIDVGDTEAVRDIDEAIDAMVYDLYGLTSQEVKALKHNEN